MKKKEPPNLPGVLDHCVARGKPGVGRGKVIRIDRDLWTWVEWEDPKKAPRILHLYELEKCA